MNTFSLKRFAAIIIKEFIQMRRDRVTFVMMIGIPLIQLVIFGYAVNSDPKHLPTVILSADNSPYVRSIVAALRNSEYFDITGETESEDAAAELLDSGRVQFVLNIPADFTRRLLRGERPSLLLEADATDPVATGNALGALSGLASSALSHELRGVSSDLLEQPGPVTMITHRKYNPEGITSHNIVPGLMGVVLTMTMVIITGLAITRERERGTMEQLLSTPARPLEVMLGKLVPYILVGYIQVCLILIAAYLLFDVPFAGSIILILACSFLFIVGNLAVGITFSTVSANQLQAMQMSVFFFLPSLLLSGFLFPFRGMPSWAQAIGNILPLTHFIRLARGILLKGNGPMESAMNLWPIALFTAVVVLIGLIRYRRTLD